MKGEGALNRGYNLKVFTIVSSKFGEEDFITQVLNLAHVCWLGDGRGDGGGCSFPALITVEGDGEREGEIGGGAVR